MSSARNHRHINTTHLVAARSAPGCGIKQWLIGESPQMAKVAEEILIAAPDNITVLITGEPGTGKELAANAIHYKSNRSEASFIVANCGGFTESLLEARLFGYIKGAFTGATTNQIGLFEAADGGTIFLDEIGNMPMSLQGYLLRVLQEQAILPIGAHREKRVDVRVIAATNCDLKRAVEEGRFRADLYDRLNGFPIRMPALREHPSDIPLLIEHFLGSTKLEKGGIELMCRYHWPGNVRELMAMIRRMKLRAAGREVISLEQVRQEIRLEKMDAPSRYTYVWHPGKPVTECFAEQLLDIYGIGLALCEGNHSKAARLLGLDRKTLDRRLARAHRIIDDVRRH
jgi:two-component system, NtrC family, response regulator AtoC